MPSTTASVDPSHLVALRCPCGQEVIGVDEEALVDSALDHLAQVHPELAGRYDADDILALSYSRPV